MEEAVGPFVLCFKSQITIDATSPEVYRVGPHELPRDIFFPFSEGSTLTLKSPWHREAGMRIPKDSDEMYYCISSGHANDQRQFFIPVNFLIMPNFRR